MRPFGEPFEPCKEAPGTPAPRARQKEQALASTRVRLTHSTRYAYEEPVWLSPHEIRLRPTAHARTPTCAYTLDLRPHEHNLKWQHDAYGNWIARVVFGAPTRELFIEVSLIAELVAHNPFDFYVDNSAWNYPFAYSKEERHALMPYLDREEGGSRFHAWLERMRARFLGAPIDTIEFLVALNRWVADDIRYETREAPGIQSCEQTLAAGSGSCRDTAWLLAQLLRHSGIATRFVSGYLVQLASGTASNLGSQPVDSLALHAWCEAYIPGAGWVGLDVTSGLLASEGHIPLACAALPASAAPVTGSMQGSPSTLSVAMQVVRLPAARA